MSTRSFFTSGAITEKNVDKIIEILNSDKKVYCANDKDFRKIRNSKEAVEFIKSLDEKK